MCRTVQTPPVKKFQPTDKRSPFSQILTFFSTVLTFSFYSVLNVKEEMGKNNPQIGIIIKKKNRVQTLNDFQ